MTKDYYKILEITEFSSTEEIKSAYRQLARKWHPDIAGNAPDVLAKFKDINEAYEILSNKTKKADYDSARQFYNYAKNGFSKKETYKTDKSTGHYTDNKNNTKNNQNEKKHFGFNWEDFIIKKYGEAQFKKESKPPKKGKDIYYDIEISVYEAVCGATKIVNMLQTSVCPKCGGRKFINGTQCSSCKGKGEISTYKRFHIKVPVGIKNNSKIRLAGEGEKGINGGRDGDLYLIVHINDSHSQKIEGLNILKTIQINPEDAVLGTEKTIETLSGNVNIKIGANTCNGHKIRLTGCGISQNDRVGDMIITLEIQTPTNLTNEEIELYKKLKEISALKTQKN